MENQTEIFWFMTIHTKFWLVPNHFLLKFDKLDGFIRVYDGTTDLILFGPESYSFIN